MKYICVLVCVWVCIYSLLLHYFKLETMDLLHYFKLETIDLKQVKYHNGKLKCCLTLILKPL